MFVYLRRLGLAVLAIISTGIFLSPSLAADTGPNSDMMATVQTILQGFNTDNFALENSQFVSDVVIVDETPPYRFEGPGANAKWWADFHKLAKAIKLTSWSFSFQKPTYWDKSNDHVYIAFPATYKGSAAGKAFTETGMESVLLVKVGSTWKCQGWAYSKVSMH